MLAHLKIQMQTSWVGLSTSHDPDLSGFASPMSRWDPPDRASMFERLVLNSRPSVAPQLPASKHRTRGKPRSGRKFVWRAKIAEEALISTYLTLLAILLLLPDQTVKCGRTCEKTRYKKGGSLVSGEDLDILGLRDRRWARPHLERQ